MLSIQTGNQLVAQKLILEKVNGSPIIPPILQTLQSSRMPPRKAGGLPAATFRPTKEKLLHANVLELKGAMLGIQSLMKNQHSKIISLNMDNSTAVAYANHKGGTHSQDFLHITLQLCNWCIQNDLYIIAYHVPGKTNVVADQVSRDILGQQRLDVRPGNYPPLSKGLLHRSVRLAIHPSTDDLHQLEARPPVSSFGGIQRELETSSGLRIPSIQFNCAISQQGRFGQDRNCPSGPNMASSALVATANQSAGAATNSSTNLNQLLINPTDPRQIHPMITHLHLGVFHISSNDSKQKAFRETLPNYSSQQLDVPHKKHTNPAGNAGAAGIFQDKLILFQHP
jgi:hypothetical protein